MQIGANWFHFETIQVSALLQCGSLLLLRGGSVDAKTDPPRFKAAKRPRSTLSKARLRRARHALAGNHETQTYLVLKNW